MEEASEARVYDPNGGCPVLRRIGFAILAVTVGLPLFGFLVLITWGVIVVPLILLAVISPLALIDYLFGRRTQESARISSRTVESET
jgi:hypothetical protein